MIFEIMKICVNENELQCTICLTTWRFVKVKEQFNKKKLSEI